MATILVLYGTTEGHTRKIAGSIEEQIRHSGHNPVLVDSATAPNPVGVAPDAVIVCGSVHQGKHQTALAQWVREQRRLLQRVPSAFVSVSLAAVMPDEESQTEARRYIEEFSRDTGWTPDESLAAAGALLYSEYDFFKRLIMKLMAGKRGHASDTSRDYEYTDWAELREFVTGLLERLDSTAPTGAAQRAQSDVS
jgi:menaquinone-dependent protoporphyrinogen oxidase